MNIKDYHGLEALQSSSFFKNSYEIEYIACIMLRLTCHVNVPNQLFNDGIKVLESNKRKMERRILCSAYQCINNLWLKMCFHVAIYAASAFIPVRSFVRRCEILKALNSIAQRLEIVKHFRTLLFAEIRTYQTR